jgi:hypothetical protein
MVDLQNLTASPVGPSPMAVITRESQIALLTLNTAPITLVGSTTDDNA